MEGRLLLSASASSQAAPAPSEPPTTTQAIWINPAGGYWDDPTNWQAGVLPGSGDDVIINQPNNPTIVFRTGSAIVNSIASSDPMALTGGSLAVSGTLDCAAGVALEGGTLIGAKVAADTQLTTPVYNVVSTLDGVEIDGDLTVAGNSTNGLRPIVCAVDGLVLDGTIHIGNGNSTGGLLEFGNATSAPGSLLGNGQLILNAGGFGNYSSGLGAGTLTIGPSVLVDGAGSINNYPNAGGGIVNQGTIVSEAISIGNGQDFVPIGFVNDGKLEVAVGGGLTIAGSYTTADLGTFDATSGTIYFEGTLDNSGATLQLGPATGGIHDWGTIVGGTIAGADGATLLGAGTLDGVTLEGSLTLVGNIQIFDGLTVNGTVDVGRPDGSTSAILSFGDNYGHSAGSLTGSGDLIFGPDKSNYISNDAQVLGNSATNTTLTIGADITIDGADGSVVGGPSDTIINQGLIEADVSGGVITIANYNGGVTSTGTFGAANGGELVVNGNYTTATFGNIAQSTGGVIEVMGTLDNTGATLNLNASTGSLTVNGTLKGGTVNESGGALLIPTTTTILDGLTINGDLNASLSSVDVTVLDGLTLNGTMEAGAQFGGNVASIYFGRTGVSPFGLWGNATVVFGINLNSITNESTLSGAAGTLTFGPNVLVRGQNGSIVNANSGGSLLIQGTVSGDTKGGTILVDDGRGTLANSGKMQAVNGGSLTVFNLGDAKGLSVTGGGMLSLLGSWANSGTIMMDNSVLELGGTFSSAGMGTINRTGGSVWLEGTVLNANSTFSLNATTGSWVFYPNAAIDGGMVSFSDGATLDAAGGTFSGVTLASDMTVADGSLQITNGMTLDGTLLVTASSYSNLFFLGTQTITAGTGNATIVLQDAGSTAALESQSGPMTLTLGPGLTVRGQGTIATAGTPGKYVTTLVNQGTIRADVPGQVLSVAPTTLTNGATGQMIAAAGWLKLGGAWSNGAGGTLAITGGTLELAGTFTTAGIGTFNWTGGTVNLSGALSNAGSTLALTATTGSWNLTSGTIAGGTLTESDGAQLNIVSGRLTGVTLASPLALDEGHALYISSGLTLSGGALVTLGNSTDNTVGQLIFDGNSQTLGGNGTLVFAGTGNSSLLIQNLINNGTVPAGLTIGTGVTIHGQNGTVTAKSSLDTVFNQGSIDSDMTGGTISFSQIGSLANAGNLDATAGTLIIKSALVEYAGSTFDESSSANVQLGGSLTATNTGPASFQALGPMELTGAGTATSPQLLEAMSQDLGNTAAGYTNNFAYASLSLAAGNDIKLTDHSKNSGSSGPEALYVNSLVVPAGATLDLSGLDLYAMNANIAGEIAGEAISLAGAGPNPSNPPQPLTFTVNIGAGIPDGETVTLVDASNQNAVLATGTLGGGSAVLNVPAGTLAVGAHDLVAVYGGDAHFAAGQSAMFVQTVTDTLPANITASTGAVYSYNSTSGALNLTSGTLTFTADNDSAPLVNLTASGTASGVFFKTSEHLAGLSLSGGAQATVLSIGFARSHTNHNVLVIGAPGAASDPTFSIDSRSKLNLEDNDLIVHTGSSDSGNGVANPLGIFETNELATVRALAASGRGAKPGGVLNGTWNGNGLSSSSAASIDAAARYEQVVLAVVQNNDQILGKLAAWTVGSFSEPLASNDIIVKYTYNGDAALEGDVGADSVTIVNGFYDGGKSTQADWAFGDFTGSGTVDDDDITILNGLYGLGTGGAGGRQL